MGALADALIARGYNQTDALNAENGPRAAELAREYGVGGSSGGAMTAESYADTIIKSQQEQIDRETKFLEQYTASNPFVFDEELARKSATEEYTPYYSELLSDYVKDLDVKRETTRDESKLLDTLQQLDRGARSRNYEQAIARAQEGFAGQGMFFSGIKQRNEGLEKIGYNAGTQGSEAQYQNQTANIGRTMQGYDTSQQRQTRDIGREQQTSIEGGILTRKKEAMANYYTPLEQSYYRQFPSSSGGALKGYTVPEYYRT